MVDLWSFSFAITITKFDGSILVWIPGMEYVNHHYLSIEKSQQIQMEDNHFRFFGKREQS